MSITPTSTIPITTQQERLETDFLYIGIVSDKFLLYYGEAMAKASVDLYHSMGKPLYIQKCPHIELTYDMYLYIGSILGYTYTSDYKLFISIIRQIECDVATILESYDIILDWGKFKVTEDTHQNPFKGNDDQTRTVKLRNKLFDTTIDIDINILKNIELLAGFEWEEVRGE